MRIENKKNVLFIYAILSLISFFLFLEINTKASVYFSEKDHPSRVIERQMGENFTRTVDTTLITLSSKESVFNTQWIRLVAGIHERLESIVINDKPAYKSVKSLINTEFIKDEDDDILIEPAYIEKAWTESDIEEITESKLMRGLMVSADGKALNIYAEIGYDIEDGITNKEAQTLTKRYINEEIALAGVETDILYGGVSVINNEMLGVMEHDFSIFIPGVVTVTLLLLCLFLGVMPALLCIAVAAISILLTMGVMSLIGYEINVITNTLPIFIITIAVTDAIHLLSKTPTEDSVKNKIKRLFRPMLFTTVTTCVGFLALSYTEIANVRSLGIMVAIGIVIALIVTWTLIPALKTTIAKQVSKPTHDGGMLSETHIVFAGGLVLLLIIGISSIGINKVIINQGGLSSFDAETSIRKDNDKMSQLGSGTIPMSVWIKHDENALSGEVLKAIESIQNAELEHVVTSSSINDYLKRMHTVFGETTPLDLNDTAMIEQYMILLEGGSERDIETVFDIVTRKDTRVVLMTDCDDSIVASEIETEIEQILSKHGIENYEIVGYGSLNIDVANDVWSAQMNSMIISIVVILGLLIALYRSVWAGLIAISPLVATLFVMFGIMGLLDIPLDVGSSIVASVCIGMGIDYSIHIMEAMRRNNNIMSAVKEVLKPIGTSAIVLSCGFSVLYLSNFFPIRSLGILISIAMIASAITAVVIIPTIYILKEKFKNPAPETEVA